MRKKKQRENCADDLFKYADRIMDVGFVATLRRILYVSVVGVLSTLILGEIFGLRELYYNKKTIIIAAVTVILLSEGNVIINRILNKKMPWFGKFGKRIRIQLLLSFLWLVIIFSFFALMAPRSLSKDTIISFTFGILFVLFINNIMIMRNFAYNWRLSVSENEQLKQAKLQADYKVLQSQLNPHFLFNSFSVLISEIQYNPNAAIEFVQKMAEVYRYVLQQRETTTTSLKHELSFISDYMFLHKTRMGETLEMVIDIASEQLKLELPPLTLQVLVENAIKHNRATDKNPLQINISSSDNAYVTVTNNLNPKSTSYSTGIGLENIIMRYKLLTDKKVIISDSDNNFTVSLPLIEHQDIPLDINRNSNSHGNN
ncbi:MAG: histidine kinase [Bacteroidales bacterium]|nr:histidine kinase [Bacteroidales bacterium]